MRAALLGVLLLGLGFGAARTAASQYDEDAARTHLNSWVVQLRNDTTNPDAVASRAGFVNVGKVGSMPRLYHFRRKCEQTDIHACVHPRAESEHHTISLLMTVGVDWAQQQKRHTRTKRQYVEPTDPLFGMQWYLGTGPGSLHLNQVEAWQANITGRGVVVTVVDDGIEYKHPDLIANYAPDASYDYNDNDYDPTPQYTKDNINEHGTRVAGAVAAGVNTYCGVGVAYQTSIGGIRMLDGPVTDSIECASLSYNPQYIDMYSSSWGPMDNGYTMEGPGPLTSTAIINGILTGRGGLGSIYVWAAGNGGSNGDNCDCDGYVNSIYTIAISSIDQYGNFPSYAEKCAALMAVTFSSGGPGTHAIVSTDLRGTCTESFSGTSAAAPIAAGVFALVLQKRPCLTWRDMQHLVANSAMLTSISDPDWYTNKAGYHVNHKFGFGRLDATSILAAAENWTTVASQIVFDSRTVSNNQAVPLVDTIELTGCDDAGQTCIDALEHVTVTATIETTDRGDLQILLTCPSGTSSTLLFPRPLDDESGTITWTYMTARCWGESPKGTWTLVVSHASSTVTESTLVSWSITLRGTSKVNDFAYITSRSSPITIQSSDRDNAVPCTACDPSSFRAADGSCWRCDSSCEYGCFGPGEGGCIADPPPIFFAASPATTDHMTEALITGAWVCGAFSALFFILLIYSPKGSGYAPIHNTDASEDSTTQPSRPEVRSTHREMGSVLVVSHPSTTRLEDERPISVFESVNESAV